MPGHFTHIYTARRVADHLLTGQFPDWPQEGSATVLCAGDRRLRLGTSVADDY